MNNSCRWPIWQQHGNVTAVGDAANHRPHVRRIRRSERRGAAAVEFAIIAPIFILLMLGMIEVGRGVMVQQVLTNASRVGARRAIVLSTTMQQAKDAAEDYADAAGVSTVTAAVSPDPASADPGDEITVTVTVDFANVTWIPSPWFMGGKVLTATSVMRKEGF